MTSLGKLSINQENFQKESRVDNPNMTDSAWNYGIKRGVFAERLIKGLLLLDLEI